MLKRLASNASANLFSGGVNAAYQLALAGVASHVWTGPDFAAWALALSFASISPLFAANLSSVVTRRVVASRHGQDSTAAEAAIVLAARNLSHQLSALALLVLLVAGMWTYGHSRAVTSSPAFFSTLLVLLLGGQLWFVALQARFGQQYAREDNWSPAWCMAMARLGGLAGFGIAINAVGAHLLAAAAGLMGGAWLGIALTSPLRRGHLKTTGMVSQEEVHSAYRSNVAVLSGFVVWSVAALLIQYGVPPIVAIIDPEHFGAFYLASTLNLIAIGAITSAMSALLAPMARWHAAGNKGPVRWMIQWGPAACAACSLVVLGLAWFGLEPVLGMLSTKAATAAEIRPFLALLGLQTIVRTAAMGHSVSLASSASPLQMSSPTLLEMTLTILVAIPAGWLFGTQAMLLGLALAGSLATLYTCSLSVRLTRELHQISQPRAVAIFCLSQAVFALLWWQCVEVTS